MSQGSAPGGWRPGAGASVLELRAGLLNRIRGFFHDRGVLEVETPALTRAASTDPNLASLRSGFTGPGAAHGCRLYLRTSPELEMKRLLANGSGPIYQISRAFRDGERGARHNPEFTLLEWYRPGFGLTGIMDEVAELVCPLLGDSVRVDRVSYQEVFRQHLSIDPLGASAGALRRRSEDLGIVVPAGMPEDDPDPWLDLLMAQCVEPQLGRGAPTFVYRYPVSQAALARVSPDDPRTAERFELYVDGMELANGFHELTDAVEQRRRFIAENAERRRRGGAEMPVDERFLAALGHGLPDCSGVALGFDRLVMQVAGLTEIDQAMAFAFNRV